jgi:hypothetical protein
LFCLFFAALMWIIRPPTARLPLGQGASLATIFLSGLLALTGTVLAMRRVPVSPWKRRTLVLAISLANGLIWVSAMYLLVGGETMSDGLTAIVLMLAAAGMFALAGCVGRIPRVPSPPSGR